MIQDRLGQRSIGWRVRQTAAVKTFGFTWLAESLGDFSLRVLRGLSDQGSFVTLDLENSFEKCGPMAR